MKFYSIIIKYRLHIGIALIVIGIITQYLQQFLAGLSALPRRA